MAEWGIEIEGLRELRSDLNRAQRKLGSSVNAGIRAAVKRHTLPAAKRAAGQLSHVPSSTPKGVGVFVTAKGAGLALSTSRTPWIAGAEWGSKRYRQFMPWVGNQYTGAGNFPGYFAGAAIRSTIHLVERDLLDEIEKAIFEKGSA